VRIDVVLSIACVVRVLCDVACVRVVVFNIDMFKYSGVVIFGRAYMQASIYADVDIFGCSNIRMFKYTDPVMLQVRAGGCGARTRRRADDHGN
jgi:hypothetical protein